MSPTATTATRRLWWATLAIIVLIVLIVTSVGLTTIARQSDQIDDLTEASTRRSAQLAEIEAANAANRATLEALGVDPPGDTVAVSASPQVFSVEGPIGPRGPGPTDDQVRVAVAAHLTANPPASGRAPTDDEIDSAVDAYLAVNPPTPGAAGPPPSAATVAAEVARWLEANPPAQGPRGEKGDRGDPGESVQGPPGPPGQSIQGPPGTAGEPPTSWSWQDPDGTWECTRDPDFTPLAPTYSCAPIVPEVE